MSQELEETIAISSEGDIIDVRKAVRDAATALGFGITDVTRIVTSASELTRNILLYAGSGMMRWHRFDADDEVSIELIFEDNGPGIADIEQAMQPSYSTGGGLGLGLPGAKRLMDGMEIESEIGKGTTVSIKKWLKG